MPGLDFTPQSQPKMPFAELARLSHTDTFEKTVNDNGYRYDQRFIECVELFHSLPNELKDWAQRRSISQRELQPLAALETLPGELLEQMALADITRNYGAQIIELLVENILLEHPIERLQPPLPFTAQKVPAWLEQLKAMRFPETQRLDKSREDKMTSLPWTKDFQTRWQRKGDQSGLEVKFTIGSKKEFEDKIESLKRVLEKFND